MDDFAVQDGLARKSPLRWRPKAAGSSYTPFPGAIPASIALSRYIRERGSHHISAQKSSRGGRRVHGGSQRHWLKSRTDKLGGEHLLSIIARLGSNRRNQPKHRFSAMVGRYIHDGSLFRVVFDGPPGADPRRFIEESFRQNPADRKRLTLERSDSRQATRLRFFPAGAGWPAST